MLLKLSIIEWQRTQGQYVAILQTRDHFKLDTLKRIPLGRGETLIAGQLVGSMQRDWYALAYSQPDMEFDEARQRAKATVTAENARRATGKPSHV